MTSDLIILTGYLLELVAFALPLSWVAVSLYRTGRNDA